jgi:RND family efflux transporter MFP subunit
MTRPGFRTKALGVIAIDLASEHHVAEQKLAGSAGPRLRLKEFVMTSAPTSFPLVVLSGFLMCVIAPSALKAQSPPPPAVLVQPAALRSLTAQSEFIGRVQALEKVDLRARVQGFLGPRRFQDGDNVKHDQTLFEIEREPFEAAVEQRKAQLVAAQATLDNAEQQLERARELVKTSAISTSTLDARVADQARAKAGVLEAQAALRDVEIKLSYTDIKSPIDGRVGRAAVSPGNLVGPDTGVLATVVQDDSVRILFPVTQREMLDARRRGGSAQSLLVRARLADGTLYDEKGKIDFIDVQVDPRTDGQIVRALFPNPKSVLAEGQTVRIVIEEEAGDKVVVIPQSAIAIDQTGPYVFVVAADNKVEQRRIRLGVGREGLQVVEDGVSAGERVVVQGQQRIRAGMIVAPQLAPALTPETKG